MAAGTEHFWASFSTLVAPITNFTAMAAIVYFGTRKSVPAALAARSDSVKEVMDRAASEFNSAKKEHDHWESQWSQSGTQASKLKEDAQASVSRIRTDVMESAKKQAARLEKDAGLLAENEARRTQLALQREIATQTIEMVENYCEKSLKAVDQRRLVNNSLESIGG